MSAALLPEVFDDVDAVRQLAEALERATAAWILMRHSDRRAVMEASDTIVRDPHSVMFAFPSLDALKCLIWIMRHEDDAESAGRLTLLIGPEAHRLQLEHEAFRAALVISQEETTLCREAYQQLRAEVQSCLGLPAEPRMPLCELFDTVVEHRRLVDTNSWANG